MTDLIECKKCNNEKPVNAFYQSTLRLTKKIGECKDCVCARVRASKQKPHRRAHMTSDAYKRTNAGWFADYQRRYPGRCQARKIAQKAIDKGELIRPTVCSVCTNEGAIEAHHDDYNHPLDVRWLCKTCHGTWHRNNKPVYINQ